MTIEERLNRLERKNRRLTLAMLLTGVAAALVVTLGMAKTEVVPDEVKAHSFKLLDDNGNTRAALDVTKDGVGLALLGGKGNTQAALSVANEEAMLVLSDTNDKPRIAMAMSKDGPMLQLGDESGKTRALLAMQGDSPGLALLNKNGKTLASLGATEDATGFALRDKNGKIRTTLMVDKDAQQLVFSDENGNVAARMIMTRDVRGFILSDGTGKPRANLVLFKDNPHFILYGESGQVLQSLPSIGQQPLTARAIKPSQTDLRTLPSDQSRATSVPPQPTAVESRIDGDFEGWEGETIVKLTNGQIWQQDSPHIEIHIAVSPKVVVYRSGGVYKMHIEGTREPVEVKRLK
jgi:hypothetical protein